MKRLIKQSIAATNVSRFLGQWVGTWQTANRQLIDNLIRENSDCVYSGPVYRFLGIDDLVPTFSKMFFDNSGEYMQLGYIPGEKVEETLKSKIKIDDKYYSSALNLDGIDDFLNTTNYSNGVIISFNASEALNIEALMEKYKDQIKDYNEKILMFASEQEIITRVPQDFTIIKLLIKGNFKDFGPNNEVYNLPYNFV